MQYKHTDTKNTRWQRIHTLWKTAPVTLFSSLSVCSISRWTATFPAWQTCARHCGRWCWAITAPCSGMRSMTSRTPHPQVRDYACVTVWPFPRIYLYSATICFLFWLDKQFPVRTHYLGAVTERATAHRGSRGCIRSYSHELLVSASNSSTYFYLNCEKSLFVTCCLSQVPHLDLLIKHQICSRYPQMKKWVTYSVSKDFVRAGWFSPLSPGSFISTYRRFISFVAHRKEWLNLRVWKEMRVLNVWRSLKWFWSGKYFFQHLLSPLWLRGHWMSQQKNNYCH